MKRTYSRPFLGVTIAPNLVPWVLKRIFLNNICLGGANKKCPFQKMCPKKMHQWLPKSSIGPDGALTSIFFEEILIRNI